MPLSNSLTVIFSRLRPSDTKKDNIRSFFHYIRVNKRTPTNVLKPQTKVNFYLINY